MSRARPLAVLMVSAALAGPAAARPAVDWYWFPTSPPSNDSAAERGRSAFQNACAACHGAANSPGTTSLGFKYRGAKPARLEERTDLTPQTVQYFIRHGVAMMPFFRKTELSDADAEAIGAYLSRPRPR